MKMLFIFVMMAGAMAIGQTVPSHSDKAKPKVSMQQAKKIALQKEPGTIKSSELEKEKGQLIYSFDIKTASGVHEVNVDANSGAILEDKVETAADEAKEKQQDAKQEDAKKKKK